MKRIAIFGLALALSGGALARAQDAASEERYNKLAGQIEDLRSSQEAITKRLETLGREIESLRGQVDKPSGNFANEEDLKRAKDNHARAIATGESVRDEQLREINETYARLDELEEESGWFRLSVGAVSLKDIEQALPRVKAALQKALA